MPRRIVVRGLPFNYRLKDLKVLFSNFGAVEEAQLITNEEGKSKGAGFLTFKTDAEAAEALEGANGHEIDGRALEVEWAKTLEIELPGSTTYVDTSNKFGPDKSIGHVPQLPPSLAHLAKQAQPHLVPTHVVIDGLPVAAVEQDLHALGFELPEGTGVFWSDVKILKNHADPPESVGVAYVQCDKELLKVAHAHLDAKFRTGQLKLSARLAEAPHRPSEHGEQAKAIAKNITRPKDPPELLDELRARAKEVQAECAAKKAAYEQAQAERLRVLELANMVPPGEFDEELAEEVRGEVEPFGKVLALSTVRDPQRIRITFAEHTAAVAAQRKFHGRWFDGRQIYANLWPVSVEDSAESSEPLAKVRRV